MAFGTRQVLYHAQRLIGLRLRDPIDWCATRGSSRTCRRTTMHGWSAASKSADLASGLGAIALGAGLALIAPVTLRDDAVPMLVAGLFIHGVGMTLKYRFESQEGSPAWWERALFWLCWVCLAALGLWVAFGVASR
jgi:hypothetical protein